MDKIMMLTTLPFSGFYESWHSGALEDAQRSAMDWEGTGDISDAFTPEQVEAVNSALDWQKACTEYARRYAEGACELLNEYLGGETPAKIELEFESLESPRFYNYTTDRIFCKIPLLHLRALRVYAGDEYMQKALDARFTPCDGFSPFYTRNLAAWDEKPLDEYDHNEAGTVLEAAIMKAWAVETVVSESGLTEGKRKAEDPLDVFEREVYFEKLFYQSPSAADEAFEAALGQAGWDIINQVWERENKDR